MSHATLIVDLDCLDRISTSLGDRGSEQLLWEAATRIAGAIEVDGIFGSFGQGRFKIALYKKVDEAIVDGVSERLHRSLRKPFAIDGRDVFMSASIGVAMGPVDSGLATHADRAARHVKSNGGDATFVIRTGLRGLNSVAA